MEAELKNVRPLRGREGLGFNATLYINGLKCLFIIDSGNGGGYNYQIAEGVMDKGIVELYVRQLKAYIRTLPPETKTYGNRIHTNEIDMDMYIARLVVQAEEEKKLNKMSKLFTNAIIFGHPDEPNYHTCDFKRPLSILPKGYLQSQVDRIVQTCCRNGVKIFNNNLKELGIIL